MTDKLKPCPFCGGYAEITDAIQFCDEERVVIECRCCGFKFEHKREFAHSKNARAALQPSAIETWNTRKPIDRIVEQLKERTFSAECYNDDFDGTQINNLLCLGDAIEIVKGGGGDDH